MKTPASATDAAKSDRKFTFGVIGAMLIIFAAMVTLTALFYIEEDLRGHYDWNKYRREAETRGVELDFKKFAPPPVPDDDNFAMTPFLAPLLDFNPWTPTPPKTGPSRWRNKAGADNARLFASNVVSAAIEKKRPASVIVSGRLTDFESVAKIIKMPSSDGANARTVLDYMSQYQPVLDEIESASHRKSARFNVAYDDEDTAGILLPHLAVVKRLSVISEIQASADLALGRTDSAAKKARLILYLSESIHTEPFLISQLVRYTMLAMQREVIWEGLAQNEWNDAQLREFQDALMRVDLAKDARMSVDAERANAVSMFDYMRKNRSILNEVFGPGGGYLGNAFEFLPGGWLYQEQTSFQQMAEDYVLPGLDPETGRVDPKKIDADFARFARRDSHAVKHFLRHDIIATMIVPSFEKWYQKVAMAETGVSETITACAIERYRLANKTLPGTLDALIPKYLDHVPMDVCNGQPLIYKPVSDRDFQLYSVGWNLTDDDGTSTDAKDASQGDWFWPMYSQK